MYRLYNIGKLDVQIGEPIILSVLFYAILPISSGYIDCRISCRRCQENTEHPSVLEVYCAMCEECKQRRREKILSRSEGSTGAVTNQQSVEHVEGLAQTDKSVYSRPSRVSRERCSSCDDDHQRLAGLLAARALPALPGVAMGAAVAPIVMPPALMFPPNCPTPPACSESEEEVTLRYEEPPKTTTTTTTTPRPTTPYRKTKRKTIPCQQPMPAMMPAMPAMMPAMPAMMPAMPPMMPCMSCAQPAYPYPCPSATTQVTGHYLPAANVVLLSPPTTTATEYQYVYVGIPKGLRKRV